MTPERERPGRTSVAVTARLYSYGEGPQDPPTQQEVAVEAPVEISFGGAPFVVMMASPSCLEELAVGFALTEGIIESYGEVRGVETRLEAAFAKVDVTLSGERMRLHLARKRAISGRTGCGVCGVESLAELPRGPARRASPTSVSPAVVGAALRALESAQPLNAATRAVHAAAWFAQEGGAPLVREDVGRHNALDKCIGRLLQDGVDPAGGFFLITSRCSHEMVAKVARFGAQTLVSLSAPTSMALQHAKDCGVALIVTARADHAMCFEL